MPLASGDRLYAIGDVHGRADLLDRLLGSIRADAAAVPSGQRSAVFLGDYVDRGPDSRAVIERAIQPDLPCFTVVTLLGNHDFMMRGFLDEPERWGPTWLLPANGGDATLASYGVDPPRRISGLVRARDALARALPGAHRTFLDALAPCHAAAPYFFAHAGVRPGVDLGRQSLDDLLWIRDGFLDSSADHGSIVVHGHSIAPQPELRGNRIGIDTGAWRTGRLTAAVLSAGAPRFLTT
jgi:serine/threonine protein phosphatase 1